MNKSGGSDDGGCLSTFSRVRVGSLRKRMTGFNDEESSVRGGIGKYNRSSTLALKHLK